MDGALAIAERYPFAQLELAGTVGLEEGRYLARDPDRVLVVRVAGAPPPLRRRLGRARPKRVDPDPARPTVPLTTLTAIRVEPLGDTERARRWLESLREDREAAAAELSRGLAFINRAVHAHRAAVLDAHLPDVDPHRALAVRIGFGDGEELADGRFEGAIDVAGTTRRRRSAALHPAERVAAVLGGRESVAACELLLLRARADLDAGRHREAALQLRAGLEALLAERELMLAPGQDEDLAALEGRLEIVAEAGERALREELPGALAEQVGETLRVCERVLRRERALG